MGSNRSGLRRRTSLSHVMSSTLKALDLAEHLHDFTAMDVAFIEDPRNHVDVLRSNLEALQWDLVRAKTVTLRAERNLVVARSEAASMDRMLNHNSFVLVLVDGDSMPFNDCLVTKLEVGGGEAAELLRGGINVHIEANLPNIQLRPDVLVRIYLNLRGLSKTCTTSSIVPNGIEDGLATFVTGFNKKFPTFEIIDAGNGKECADSKIKKTFELFAHNVHCKHNARLLSQYSGNEDIRRKVALLEGPPFANEMGHLAATFGSFSIPSVFRGSKITFKGTVLSQSSSLKRSYTAVLGTSLSSRGENGKASQRFTNLSMRQGTIRRNKYGQRIDSPLYAPTEVISEVRSRGYCNEYHLKGYCYTYACAYSHDICLTHIQRTALRKITMRWPCPSGPKCASPDCYRGHMCLGKPCDLGSGCRFPLEMHVFDTRVIG